MSLESGARFSLHLTEQGKKVVYRVEVEMPGEALSCTSEVDLETGEVGLVGGDALPAWLKNTLSGLLRSLWRVRRDASPAEAWPRRLTRWRKGDAEA